MARSKQGLVNVVFHPSSFFRPSDRLVGFLVLVSEHTVSMKNSDVFYGFMAQSL